MAFPSSVDSYTAISGTTQNSPVHAGLHNTAGSAIIQIENKLGTGSGSASADKLLVGSGAGVTGWTSTWNNGILGTPTLSYGFWGTARITGGTIINVLVGTSQITGGTITSAAYSGGTMNNPEIDGAVLGTPRLSGAILPSVGTLTDAAGGTMAINAKANQLYELTVLGTAGNRTMGTPTNGADGAYLGFRFKQNAANNGTIVYASVYRFPANGTPVIGTAATWNYAGFRFNNTDSKWDYQGQSSGLI